MTVKLLPINVNILFYNLAECAPDTGPFELLSMFVAIREMEDELQEELYLKEVNKLLAKGP